MTLLSLFYLSLVFFIIIFSVPGLISLSLSVSIVSPSLKSLKDLHLSKTSFTFIRLFRPADSCRHVIRFAHFYSDLFQDLKDQLAQLGARALKVCMHATCLSLGLGGSCYTSVATTSPPPPFFFSATVSSHRRGWSNRHCGSSGTNWSCKYWI